MITNLELALIKRIRTDLSSFEEMATHTFCDISFDHEGFRKEIIKLDFSLNNHYKNQNINNLLNYVIKTTSTIIQINNKSVIFFLIQHIVSLVLVNNLFGWWPPLTNVSHAHLPLSTRDRNLTSINWRPLEANIISRNLKNKIYLCFDFVKVWNEWNIDYLPSLGHSFLWTWDNTWMQPWNYEHFQQEFHHQWLCTSL